MITCWNESSNKVFLVTVILMCWGIDNCWEGKKRKRTKQIQILDNLNYLYTSEHQRLSLHIQLQETRVPTVKQHGDKERFNNHLAAFLMGDNKANQHLLNSTYLTPEPEVLHFGFEVPDIGYLWPILTVEQTRRTIFNVHSTSMFS